MNTISDLVEQHILESEAHLRQIDELTVQANERIANHSGGPAAVTQIAAFRQKRDEALLRLDSVRQLRGKSLVDAAEKGAQVNGTLHLIAQEMRDTFAELFKPDDSSS